MRVKESYLILASVLLMIYVMLVTSFAIEEAFIVAFQVYLMLKFVNNIGYTICFFDFLCFYSVLDTLLMPLLGYKIYNQMYSLSRNTGWYMRVPQDVYYSFLIPANMALFVGLNFLIRKFDTDFYRGLIAKLEAACKDKGKIGIGLTVIGAIATFLTNTRSALDFVFYLLAMLKYIGPVYIYFSNSPFKKQALIVSMLFFLADGIIKGMFGEFVMYVVLIFIIVSLKFNLRFFTKLGIMVAGLFLIVILQSVKSQYRAITWQGRTVHGLSSRNTSQWDIFSSLIGDRVENFSLFDKRAFFGTYIRMNQGYLISRAMIYVPRVEPYANGTTIVRALAGVLVPRLLWPDKPQAGGSENLARFVGIKKKVTYSMNIGPYGEAYGNFGPVYGIAFILAYGLLLSFAFKMVIVNSISRPTLLLWLPVLFFSTLTVETDILSTLNAFFKAYLFMLFLIWAARRFFKVTL